MKFFDNIDGRTLVVDIYEDKGVKFIGISTKMVKFDGEGCFLPNKAKEIGQHIISLAERLENDEAKSSDSRRR